MVNSKSIILFKIYLKKLIERGIEYWLKLSSNTNIELDPISECAHVCASETFYSTKGQRPKARLASSTL